LPKTSQEIEPEFLDLRFAHTQPQNLPPSVGVDRRRS
jgi:hypothetical protein